MPWVVNDPGLKKYKIDIYWLKKFVTIKVYVKESTGWVLKKPTGDISITLSKFNILKNIFRIYRGDFFTPILQIWSGNINL